MPRTIHALLIGIDEYKSPIPRLFGCVNDIQAFGDYLENRVAGDASIALEMIELANEKATKEAVVKSFRSLLGKARKDDVALFYYSGHGSQEQAPEEFWEIEPDHLDETLVLYDSRDPDQFDLADKELASLIDEVASNGAHVLVILDCCHSGSGTRDVGTVVRRAPTDLRRRPIESFLQSPSRPEARSSASKVAGWRMPEGRHVLFAACRSDEEAKEHSGDGKNRGAFSYFLGEALKSAAGVPTYRDLFARTASLVSGQVNDQSPQLEVNRQDDLDAIFLDGIIRPAPASFTASFQANRWMMDAGSIHGISPASQGETTRIALFRFDAPAADLQSLDKAIATARVETVMAATSMIAIENEIVISPLETFKALIISLPAPRTAVAIVGEIEACELARKYLSTATMDKKPSPFVRESVEGEVPEFRLLAQGGSFLITRPTDDRPLVAPIQGLDEAGSILAIKRLEHMARWTKTLRLSNPSSSILPGDVRLSFQVIDEEKTRELGSDVWKEQSGSEIRLEYRPDASGKLVAPRFKVAMTNTTGRTLYCGLLDLTQRYRIFTGMLSTECEKLEQGQTVWARNGASIPASVPDEVFQQGVIEYKDWLKLIVSTRPFNARFLELPTLDMPRTRAAGSKGLSRDGSLNRLMERMTSRELGDEDAPEIDDWQATGVSFTTIRPLDTAPIPGPESTVTLAGGITLDGHSSFRANARLSTASLSTRDLKNVVLPRLLYEDPSVVIPWTFTPTRGTDPGLSVLELTGVNDPTMVTLESPLRINVPQAIGANDSVLPVAFDGEFYLPLGGVESRGEDSTVVSIVRLPEPIADGRSLGGAIKIFFRKIIGKALGVESSYPILGIAEVAADASVTPIVDPDLVRERVMGASRIVLFVHGIIGETSTMVPSLRLATLPGGETPLSSLYDLVLTFDYENLNTTIQENGRLLRKHLDDCGLVAGTGKILDVVAHSMGGLVSRWFIEKEGGKDVVRRLVMLGTPNDGSPWPRVANWATTAIALGLNHFTAIPWPSVVLGQLQKVADSPTVALNEMERGSEVLTLLSTTEDPGIPYTMIAGNTSIIASALANDPLQGNRLSRLLARISSPGFLHDVANPFFVFEPNDVAVSVASMKKIAPGRTPPYVIRPVACDHMSYFHDAEGLKALSIVLSEGVLAKPTPPDA